ncbi:MAG: hypothetical protein B6U68_01205 [Candidatus Aenigmarchaeota archaeon ex4484_14]|nr:MAG: hypothetical protein B6U68_01205 [Candidatus Aenigmarchaeota archaeon ex4484_14]
MSKGQKSLEMIVGMIILLVVAGVIINMFMKTMGNAPTGLDPKQQELNKIISNCNQWCGGASSGDLGSKIDYCSHQFSLVGEGEVAERREGIKPYCEDSIYCFLVHDCKLANGQKLTAKRCKQILCQKFKSDYLAGDSNEVAARDYASDKITRLIKKGSCDLGEGVDNWYLWVFRPESTDKGLRISCE